MLRALIAKIRNVPYAWSMGYFAGRIASANATQRHWADTVASLVDRAQKAEMRADGAEREIHRLMTLYDGSRSKMAHLEAILQTRNLSGGWMPNGKV